MTANESARSGVVAPRAGAMTAGGHVGASVAPKLTQTLAQRFRDAVWEAGPEQLSTTEAMVLLAYADHARGGDVAWVAQSRLMQRCKLRSKDTPSRVVADLVDKGWLELLSPAQWHNRKSPTYRLRIPTSPMSGEIAGVQSPRSNAKPPRSAAKPPRSVAETSPMSGAYLPDDRVPLSSEGPSGPSGGDDLPRTASPRSNPPEDQNPADADGPSMAAEDAREQIRQMLADKGRAKFSRWSTHREAAPNPAYDPAVTVAQLAELAALLPANGTDQDHGGME